MTGKKNQKQADVETHATDLQDMIDEDQAIMEVEMSDETEEIEIPSFIQVIREVTEDENYKNAALAHFPLEADLQRR